MLHFWVIISPNFFQHIFVFEIDSFICHILPNVAKLFDNTGYDLHVTRGIAMWQECIKLHKQVNL